MGKNTLVLLIMLTTLFSCESENSDFAWQYKQGSGHAYFIENTSDSGFVSAGTLNGKAFTMMTSKDGKKVFSFSSQYDGSYQTVWRDTSVYMVAGVSGSSLVIGRLSKEGTLVWENMVETGGLVSTVFLYNTGGGNFSAVCSAGTGDVTLATSTLSVVSFDTSGVVTSQKSREFIGLFAVTGIAGETDGALAMSVTKVFSDLKPHAYAIQLGSDLNSVWEKELITNPSYDGASLGICRGASNGIYIIGRTEYTSGEDFFINTFISSITSTGMVNWTKYPESSNEGVAVRVDESAIIHILNRNCFIVNRLEDLGTDVLDQGGIKVLSVCDSYDTDALASSFTINHEGNLLLAGSQAGSYFIGLKNIAH